MTSRSIQISDSHPLFIPDDNLCDKCKSSVIWRAFYYPSSLPHQSELYDAHHLQMSTRSGCPFCALLSTVYDAWLAHNSRSSEAYVIRLISASNDHLYELTNEHLQLYLEFLRKNDGEKEGLDFIGIFLDGGNKGITGIIKDQIDQHSLGYDGMYCPVLQRRLAILPSSAGSIYFIKKQMEHCMTRHEKCNGKYDCEMPTRLIDVGSEFSWEPIRLVESIGSHNQYIALSHCWGTKPTTKLLKQSFMQMLRVIDVDNLPANFRDAIQITRLLGYRFLWIDSLCIIQDDASDWGRESARMASVYGNAVLTIGATRAADSHAGFLSERSPYILDPILIGTIHPDNVTLRAVWEPNAYDRYGINHLASRAWCLQELLLSARFLHVMKNEMLFECKTDLVWESGRVDLRAPQNTHPEAVIRHSMRRLAGDGHFYANPVQTGSDVPVFGAQTRWEKIIVDYARRALTKSNDKLIAVSGLARALQPSEEAAYCAGLWQTELPQALLWSAGQTESSRAELHPSERYRAPSWSWASVDGPINYGSALHYSYGSEIFQIYTEPSGQDYFGAVKAGYMIIAGEAMTMKIDQIHAQFDHEQDAHDLKSPFFDIERGQKIDSRIFFDTKRVPNCAEIVLLLIKARGYYTNVNASSPRPHGLVLRLRRGSTEGIPGPIALALDQGLKCFSRVGTFLMREVVDGFQLSWFPKCKRKVFIIV